MRAAEFYRPDPDGWGVVWRLFLSPWVPLWATAFNYQDLKRFPLWEVVVDVVLRTAIVGVQLAVAAVLVGYLAYILYRQLNWTNPIAFAAGGAIVSPLAILILILLYVWPAIPTLSAGDIPVEAEFAIRFFSILAGNGAIAGLIFWALLRWRRRPVERGREADT